MTQFKGVYTLNKTTYLKKNKGKDVKVLKNNTKGVVFTPEYINIIKKSLNKKLDKLGSDAITAQQAFDHLKNLNLFDKNTTLDGLTNTSLGKQVATLIKKHNAKAANTLKAYTIWAAVTYKQKDADDRVVRTQRAMDVKSYKNKEDFTPEFIEDKAREWMERNWVSPVEFIGLDYENYQPPYIVTKLKDVDLNDLPLYSFKEDITKGMRLHSKFLPLFDGLVQDPDDYLTNEFENKCGEFSIYYTLAKAVMQREINKQYIDPDYIDKFFKGKFTLKKIRKYFEMIGRVNVRIFDQVGTVLVKVDASEAVCDVHGVDDGTGNLAFKRARATLCAVVADTSGVPHIHIISDPNAKNSIMQTGNLNIFPSTWYYGSNFEYVEDPIHHTSNAKLILFDANKEGHSMDQVIGAIMKRTGYVILNIKYDPAGAPVSFIEPTTAQQYTAVENYFSRKAIADDLYNELKFSEFEWHGQSPGELCYEYLRLKHNRELSQLKSFFSQEMHQVVYEHAIRGQYIAKCDDENDAEDQVYTGFDENTQFGDILVCMETDWIALDYWSEMVEFDVSKHTANSKLVHGLYLLNRCPRGFEELLMFFPETCYTSHMIKFLLQVKAITYDDIAFVVVAPKVFKNDYFKIPFTELRKRYHDNPAWYKAMQNQFVGRLYKMFNKSHQVAILFNHDFAQGLRVEWEKDHNSSVTLNSTNTINNIWWLKKTTRDAKFCSAALIRVQILEEAKIRNFWRAYHLMHGMDKRSLINSNCKILCHMCDCTIVENPNETERQKALVNTALEKKDRPAGSLKIELKKRLTGKTSSEYKEICESVEPYVPKRPEINVIRVTPSREHLDEHVNHVINAKSALVTATKGGGGKSFLMTATAVELKKQNKKVVFLLSMHKHKDTVISKGKMFNVEFKHKEDIFLHADIMNKKYFELVKMFMSVHVVILEEIAQTNTDYIRTIAMLQRKCGFRVLASGDDMQCDPPLEKYQVYVNLFDNKYFRQMTGNNEINLQYNPEFGRYPEDLANVISEFHKTFEFPDFPVATELTKMHLTCTNTKAREMCSTCSEHFSQGRTRLQHHEFYYCEGMPLVGVQNNGQLKGGVYDENTKFIPKNYQVHNREEYEILTLNDVSHTFSLYNKRSGKVLENVELNSVYNMMMPFYAMTIDASQSSQIDMPFTMHELNNQRFSIELANVAMSRSTKLEYIFRASDYQPEHVLQHTKRNISVRCFPLNDHTNNKYSDTKIYEIWVEGVPRYGGHTYLTVEERLKKHLQDSKRNPHDAFHKYLATVNHSTDVEIKEVKRYHLENRAQAESVEMQYVNDMIGKGHKLLNVKLETAEDRKIREIEASTNDMRIQSSILKEIAKRVKPDDLQFSVYDYPDDKFFNVSHKLLDNEPVSMKFKYTIKGKGDVQHNILQYLNDIRKKYKLPPAFASWDSVPTEVLKTKIEKQLAETNISSQTFIGFHCVDVAAQRKVSIYYSINNSKRKRVHIRYAKEGGIDNIKDKMSEAMNKIRVDNGLDKVEYKWDGLEFTEIEQ